MAEVQWELWLKRLKTLNKNWAWSFLILIPIVNIIYPFILSKEEKGNMEKYNNEENLNLNFYDVIKLSIISNLVIAFLACGVLVLCLVFNSSAANVMDYILLVLGHLPIFIAMFSTSIIFFWYLVLEKNKGLK